MPFSIDFLDDGRILEWEATADGTVATERDDYTPCFYVGARDPETDLDLTTLQSVYDQHPDVVATEMVTQRPGFRRDEGGRSRGRRRPHRPRHPTRPASAPAVGLSSRGSRLFQRRLLARVPVLSGDRRRSDAGERAVDTAAQRPSDRNEQRCLWGAVRCRRHRHRLVDGYPDRRPRALETHDPDVLVCSTSEIVPTLYEMATDADVDDFSLSRWPDVDYQQLASRSTYSSYGRVGHSPARYNVPGRAIIDESNTFFYGETNLDGVLDLVSRSKKARPGTRVGVDRERAHRHPNLRGQRPRRPRAVELLAPRVLQAGGDAPRRRPRRLHFRTRGRPPRRTSTNSTSPRCIRISSALETSHRTSSGVTATATATTSPASGTRSVTTGATSSTSSSRSSTPATRSRRPSVTRRNGTTPTRTDWRNSRTVGSAEVDPRCLFRLSKGSATRNLAASSATRQSTRSLARFC